MTFTIFSLGDTHLFAEILNGVAMLFSNGDVVHGNNPMNLSFGAFFGSIVLLVILVYKSVFEKHIEIKTLIMPLMLYMILTIPKTTLIIDDLYRLESPQRVDNVPIGLALPAAVVSGLGKVFADVLEATLYVPPTGSLSTTTSKVTEDGFLTPLQILNSMRFDDLSKNHPLLQQTFNQVYANCVANNQQFSFLQYERSPESFKYVMQQIGSATGLVNFQVSQAGLGVTKTMSCGEAGALIEAAINAHMTGNNDISGLLGSNYKKHTFAEQLSQALANKGTILKNSNNSPVTFSYTQISNIAADVMGISEAQSRAFMTSIVFDPMVKTASYCASEYTPRELSKCTAFVASSEQWKEASAASATSFFKNLRNGQNILVLIGFMLFPIVIFLIMLQGYGSIRLVAGYIIFMISNYLWIPFAVIINYYSQSTFQEAMYLLSLQNPSASLTITQAPQFFDLVSTKLGVANNAIGMIPMFTTMIFGGAMWAMNSFGKQINPAGTGYNAKINAPSIQNAPAIAQGSSLVHKDGLAPSSLNGASSFEAKFNSEHSALQSEITTLKDNISQAKSRMEQIQLKEGSSEAQGLSQKHGSESASMHGTRTTSELGKQTSDSSNFKLGATHSESAITKLDEVSLKEEQQKENRRFWDASAGVNVQVHPENAVNAVKNLFGFGDKNRDNNIVDVGVKLGLSGNVQRQEQSGVDVTRNTIGIDKNTPTHSTDLKNERGTDTGETSSRTWTGKTGEYTVSGNSSNQFIARQLNEAIQNSNSGAISDAEKREANFLMSKIDEWSARQTHAETQILSLALSANQIAGSVSEFSPNHENASEGFRTVNAIGQNEVSNWNQLKEEARNLAIKGGLADSAAIEAVSTFYASMLSGNKDLALMSYQAVTGEAFSSQLRETNVFEPLKDKYEDAKHVADVVLKSVDTSNAHHTVSAATNFDYKNIVSDISTNTLPAKGLSEREDQLRHVRVASEVDFKAPSYEKLSEGVQAAHDKWVDEAKNTATYILNNTPDYLMDDAFKRRLSNAEQRIEDLRHQGKNDEAALVAIEVMKMTENLKNLSDEGMTKSLEHYNANNPTAQSVEANTSAIQEKLNGLQKGLDELRQSESYQERSVKDVQETKNNVDNILRAVNGDKAK